MNIIDEIFRHPRGEAPALITRGAAVSYADLESRMETAAAALRASALWPVGVRFPRVALSIPNGVDHIVWSLAVLRLGGVLVPVPGELAPPERLALVETTACHAVLAAAGQAWTGPCEETEEIAGLTLHRAPGVPAEIAEEALAALEPALIRFSSGTTGRSKGVVLSHRTLLERVTAGNSGLRIGPGDRVLWILPMAHHFAVSIVLYLLHGAATVLAESHLGADLLAELESSAATVLYAAPYHYALLAGCPAARPLPTLRLAVSTAAPLPATVSAAFREKFALPLTQGLGIIEAGLPVLNTDAAEESPEAVGRPQAGFEVRIDQPDAQGIGEILLRGPGMFDAYLSPWRPRAEVLTADGWLRTGDLGKVSVAGLLTLAGRLKSVINVAGLKCFPEEIEAVLNTHPDVKESRVYAQPHPDTGSTPAAEIVPVLPGSPPKPVSLNSHCRRSLAAYKIPLRFTFVTELPRTASGKIQR